MRMAKKKGDLMLRQIWKHKETEASWERQFIINAEEKARQNPHHESFKGKEPLKVLCMRGMLLKKCDDLGPMSKSRLWMKFLFLPFFFNNVQCATSGISCVNLP